MNIWFQHVGYYHCFPHLARIALMVIVSKSIVNRNTNNNKKKQQKITPRIAFLTMNICLQTVSANRILRSLVSRKALRERNALRALPANPFFENEKSKGSEE